MKAILYRVALFFLCLYGNIAYAQYSIAYITDATNGQCNGAINLYASQEEGPLTFLWSDGSTDKDAMGLCAGTYTVTITTNSGCETMLEATVDGSGCTVETLAITADIVHYCAPAVLGRISINIPGDGNYTLEWDNNTPKEILTELTDLQPGNYCVNIIDDNFAGCERRLCYDIIDENCDGGNNTPVVIINEVSDGPTGGEEFVEILVIGDGSCNPVNLAGFILDDNDGTFSAKEVKGTGVAPGHIRFAKNQNNWNAIPVGSIILIYNNRFKNALISLADDPDDQDGDQVYILPANHPYLETNALYPRTTTPLNYNLQGGDNGYRSGGDWDVLGLYEYADAIQIRQPNGNYMHGVSYGISELIKGGPDNLHLSLSNGREKVFAFQDNDYRKTENYLMSNASGQNETPGAPNSTRNADYIASLCSKKGLKKHDNDLITIHDGSAVFHPNPFSNEINIELDWSTPAQVQVRLYDLLGKIIIEQPLNLVKGYNQFNLNIPADFPSGLYHIAICQNNKILVGQKIIRARTEN